jgi:c(7)-type cytochrome triheme protein
MEIGRLVVKLCIAVKNFKSRRTKEGEEPMMKYFSAAAIIIVFAFMAVNVMAVDSSKSVTYTGGGQGKVVFSGKIHADKGLSCNDCHSGLFTMKKEAKITMADHTSGKFCFACHNGTKAFNTCTKCHKK